jgi:hypothetical protein
MAEHCMVQSFDHDCLGEIEKVNKECLQRKPLCAVDNPFQQQPCQIATLYLHNFYDHTPRSDT